MRQGMLQRRGFYALVLLLAARTAASQEQGPGWAFGPGARLSRPNLELQLTGYIQEDFRSFHDYENASGQLPALASDTELRRFRGGLEAHWERLSLDFSYDFHDDTEHLKNAYL